MFRQLATSTFLWLAVLSVSSAPQALGQDVGQADQEGEGDLSSIQEQTAEEQTDQQQQQQRQQRQQQADRPGDEARRQSRQTQDQALEEGSEVNRNWDNQLNQSGLNRDQGELNRGDRQFRQQDQDFAQDDRDTRGQRQARQQEFNFGAEFNAAAEGLTVRNINQGTLASQIGLQQGDEIVAVGGQEVFSQAEVNRLLTRSGSVDQRVPIIVRRDGRRTTLYVEPFMLRDSFAMAGQSFATDLGVAWVNGPNNQLIVRDVTGGLGRTLGLQADDVVVAVAGRRVTSPAQFQRWIYDSNDLDAFPLPVVVLRDGRRITLYLEQDELDFRPRDQYVYRDGDAWLGVTFDPRYGNRAVVQDVVSNSPADHAGVRRGDWIIGLNGRRVSSSAQVSALVDAMQPGEDVEIQVARRVSRTLLATLATDERYERRQALRPPYDDFDDNVQIRERPYYRQDLNPQGVVEDFDADLDRRGLRDRVGPPERGLRDRLDRDQLPDERPGVLRTPY